MTDDEIRAIRSLYDRGYTTTAANDIPKLLDEIERLRAEAERADEEATTLANSDLATTEQVVRALRAENARLRAAAEEVLSWPTKDMAMLLSNPPQNAALFRAQSVLRRALEKP